MQNPKKLEILLIEDHEIVAWALSYIIKHNIPDAELHTAVTFDQGIRLLEKYKMNLVVLDINIPGSEGPKMIEILRHAHHAVRILIHTAISEDEVSIKYLTAGADGFISKSEPFPTIVEALTTVLKGEQYMSSKTQKLLAKNYLKSVSTSNKSLQKKFITPREAEIIPLLLQGKWTKEIASELGIKWSTVSTHKLSILDKFGVSNVLELYKKVQKENPELLDNNVFKTSVKSC
jgi:two-component system invasion response regulator UvrY